MNSVSLVSFFFSSRIRHTRCLSDWSSDVCSSDLDGTYTATFTGTTAGTNTITAAIGGQPVTSTAPTVTVTAAGTPGAISRIQSTVAVSPASVAVGGTSTVTLTAKDANGTPLPTGGATIALGLGPGPTVGTFGPVTDNNDGTYTATFTGTAAGSNTVTATIGGQPVTTPPPPITVTAGTPGAISAALSTVALSPASIETGGTTTVTLTARTALGAPLTTGGATVTFALAGDGTIQGTFGNVTDNGNGTYTATFTATAAGTDTIAATVNGLPVTSTAPSLTVT